MRKIVDRMMTVWKQIEESQRKDVCELIKFNTQVSDVVIFV